MEWKVFFSLVLINIVSLVNGYVHFEPPNHAMDQSLYEEALDTELCDEQIQAIRANPLLTINFADAGPRIPTGILQGNTINMGNYHQCIGINTPLDNSELQGKYCVIHVPVDQNFTLPALPPLPPLPPWLPLPQSSNYDSSLVLFDKETFKHLEEYSIMRKEMQAYTGIIDDRVAAGSPLSGLEFTMGVCIPKPCTTRQAFDSFLFNISAIGFDYSDAYCRLPNDKPRVPGDYVAIALFSLLGLVTLVSSSYDLWHTFVKKTDSKSLSVLGKSFSVYTNGRRLMTFNSGADTIECLDGIRALAMAWVLLGHSFTTEVSWANPIDAWMWSSSWKVLWVSAAHYTVDTFFTLSGFLIVYTTVGKLTGKGLLKNLHLYYLNRLLRMFPLLAAAVLLEATLLNHMTDGPDWTVVSGQVNNCRATWWSTLLHMQNFMNPAHICLVQTWYLAIDVQLHILSPIILVWVLCGNKKLAWSSLAVGCLSVVTTSAIFIFIKRFPPVMVAAGREHEMRDYVNFYYVNTLTRAPPFFVGMLFGYLLRVTNIKLRGLRVILFWIIFFTISTYLIYFTHVVSQPTWDNQFMSSFYNAFFRAFWAVIVGALIFACKNGFAGPINWFLSLQVWKVHSRLSYGLFVFHYLIMSAVNNTAVAPFFFSPGAVMYKFLGHYVCSLAISFLLTLLIDAPFSTLFKVMMGGGIKKPVKKNEDNNEPTKESDKRTSRSQTTGC